MGLALSAGVFGLATGTAFAAIGNLGAALLLGYILLYVVPTVLLYTWIVFFGAAALAAWLKRRRTSTRWIFTALALAPLAAWVTTLGIAAVANERHRTFLTKSEALPPLANPPRTLVVHTNGLGFVGPDAEAWRNELVEMGAFDEIYVTGPWAAAWTAALQGPPEGRRMAAVSQPMRHRYARSETCQTEVAKDLDRPWWIFRARAGFLACAITERVDDVPRDGLHLYIGNEAPSRASDILLGYLGGSGPYELRLRRGDDDQLVGYWEVSRSVWPKFPPAAEWGRFQQSASVMDYRQLGKDSFTFILERMGIDPDQSRPPGHPSDAEVEAKYQDLIHSDGPKERDLAFVMAAAFGRSMASNSDVEDLLSRPEIVARIVRWSRGMGFCRRLERLREFKADLVAACRRNETNQQGADQICYRFETSLKQCDTPEGWQERALQ